MMLRSATTNIITEVSKHDDDHGAARARIILVFSITSIRTSISCVGIIFQMYLDHFMTLSNAPAVYSDCLVICAIYSTQKSSLYRIVSFSKFAISSLSEEEKLRVYVFWTRFFAGSDMSLFRTKEQSSNRRLSNSSKHSSFPFSQSCHSAS